MPRGFASEFPEKYELDDEEMERITKMAQLEIKDAKESLKTAKQLSTQVEIDDDLKEYDLEHYDDDDEMGTGESFSMIPGLSNEIEFHDGNEEDGTDPYISLPNNEDIQQEKQESQIYPTDNLVLATRTEDDVSYLDIYIYDDGAGAPEGSNEEEGDKLDPDVARGMKRDSSLYMHHDLMLPTFPLTVEWINYRPNAAGDDANNVGNFAAIGTFDPQIEVWNLDCIDKSMPDLILGEPVKMSKKKLKNANHIKTHHVGAVLSLAHNKYHRNILASTSADHTVKLWDLNKSIAVRSMNSIHSNKEVSSSQWHKQEESILLTGGYDGRIAISDVRISDEADMSKFYKIGGSQDIEVVKWLTNDKFLAGSDQGNIYCFDIKNQDKPLWTLKAHDSGISSLDINNFLPNLIISSGMNDKLVKLWKVPTDDEMSFKPSMVLSRDFGVGNVLTTSFSPDIEVSGHMVVGGATAGLKMFDIFSNSTVKNNFKPQLKEIQKAAREEAARLGRSSRIARKYNEGYKADVLQVESDGDDEEEEEEDEGQGEGDWEDEE